MASVALINDRFNVPITAGYGPSCDITGGSFWIRIKDSGCQGTDSVNTPTSDNAAALLIDGRTNNGNFLIFVDDFETSEGGIKFYAGNSGGSLRATKVTSESTKGEPTVWFASTGSGGDSFVTAHLDTILTADPTVNAPSVEADISTDGGIVVSGATGQGTNIVGPVTILSQYGNNLQNQVVSPQRSFQQGFIGGWAYGFRDDVQRGAALTNVRFANQVAGSACSSWQVTQFSGTSTKTCAVADPFGGANAGQASSNNAATEFFQFLPGSTGVENVSLSVGEYILGGVWLRSQTANGYPNSAQNGAQLVVTGTGFTASGSCQGDSVLGDGEWTWHRCIYKITAVGTNPGGVEFGAQFNSTHTVQAYAPVINFIAPGTLSDNEADAYENALQTYDASCVVGTSCGMEFNSIQGAAFQSLSANPAQSGIVRLADTDALAWRNHANTADVSLSKNSSDQLVSPPFASPTFFSPIVDSASGASGVTFRNGGTSVWTANAAASGLSFNFNAHLGETTMKLAPFGGQSYASLLDNYGMAAGFVAVTETGGTVSFDAGLGNTFEVTLTANVTSSTLSNAQPGQWLNLIVCQPSTGGPFTFSWPASVHGGMTIGTTAGKCSAQSFIFDGTSAFATSPGVANQ